MSEDESDKDSNVDTVPVFEQKKGNDACRAPKEYTIFTDYIKKASK